MSRFLTALPRFAPALLLCTACHSVDPPLEDRNGDAIAQRPPATYRIGVLPATIDAQDLGLRSQYGLSSADGVLLSQMLVAELNAAGAATEIIALESGSEWESQRERLDLVFEPRVRESVFEERSTRPGKAVLSTFLWLFTWVGGLWVDDKQFDTALEVEAAVYSGPDGFGRTLLGTPTRSSGRAYLSFFERNEAWSLGFFGSLFMPPFLVGSGYERTSETLTERALTHLAARWKLYLLDELETELGYSLKLVGLENGATAGERLDLELSLFSRVPLADVALELNGSAIESIAPLLTRVSEPDQPGDIEYRVSVPGLVLRRGANELRIAVGSSRGAVYWRTLRLFGGAQ